MTSPGGRVTPASGRGGRGPARGARAPGRRPPLREATRLATSDLAARRFDRLDAIRGAAVVWMAAFHFSFDLSHFGFTQQDFYRDPVWTLQRVCIVTLFLACSGVGQAVALEQAQGGWRFWRRWLQIAGCAGLVSVGSWWMFPRSYISFGVLHCVAVALLVVRVTSPWRRGLWLAGALALAAPWFVSHPWFDPRATNWVGLVTHKPITEDYVPLLPWLGVVWWGVAAGRAVLRGRRHLLDGPVPGPLQPLAVLGRWSLGVYMLHQPVLIGLLSALVWWRGS